MLSTMSVIVRPCARVLLLDPHDRLLLIHCRAPDDGRRFWITPGGGLEAGESETEAARRELWEEVGDVEARIGPAVWLRRHVFDWDRRRYDQRETFYVARTPVAGTRPVALSPDEMHFIEELRWWTLEEILAAPPETTFAPRRLGPLLRELLDEGFPSEPKDVGV